MEHVNVQAEDNSTVNLNMSSTKRTNKQTKKLLMRAFDGKAEQT